MGEDDQQRTREEVSAEIDRLIQQGQLSCPPDAGAEEGDTSLFNGRADSSSPFVWGHGADPELRNCYAVTGL